jgi:phosphoribosylaminoimidazole-succinocarboxamide synthase
MEKRELLYTGKAKSVYTTDHPDFLVMVFRDDTSAFDGKKVEQLARKGMVNNIFNAFIMGKLAEAGISSHLSAAVADRSAGKAHDHDSGGVRGA